MSDTPFSLQNASSDALRHAARLVGIISGQNVGQQEVPDCLKHIGVTGRLPVPEDVSPPSLHVLTLEAEGKPSLKVEMDHAAYQRLVGHAERFEKYKEPADAVAVKLLLATHSGLNHPDNPAVVAFYDEKVVPAMRLAVQTAVKTGEKWILTLAIEGHAPCNITLTEASFVKVKEIVERK